MNKSEANTQGWPLVPVDPAAIPEGYEVVRVGWPVEGETSCTLNCTPHTWKLAQHPVGCVPILIIRPIPKPIRLPTSIVPHGWWVARDSNGEVWCYEERPKVIALKWGGTNRDVEKLPPWIAAQLPAEWHALPWNQSAVQQQEGGEG